MQLDVAAEIAIEVATFDAERRGHGAVGPLHALAALRFDAAGIDGFRELVASPRELAEQIEAALAAPDAHAYRGGGARAPAWLDGFLARAGASKSRRFWQRVGRAHLLEAIAEESLVRGVIARCTIEHDDEAPVDPRHDRLHLRRFRAAHHALVRRVLEAELGVDPSEALRLVLTATRLRGAYVGAYARATLRGLFTAMGRAFAPGAAPRLFSVVPSPATGEEPTSLDRTISHALEHARRRGHDTVQLAHVARALLDDARLVSAFAGASAPLEAMRADADALLQELTARWPPSGPARFASREFNAWAAHVRSFAWVQGDPSPARLFSSVPPNSEAAVALTRTMSRFELLYLLEHRVAYAAPRPDGAEDGALDDVVFHDDGVTTMEFVAAVLEEVFGLAHDDAVATMLRVNDAGRRSSVASPPRRRASWRPSSPPARASRGCLFA